MFFLEMGAHVSGVGLHRFITIQQSNWLQLALATPVVLWAGWPFFQRGWASLLSRNLNMFTLIAMGVGAAYVYSVLAALTPQIFPESFRHEGGHKLIVDSRLYQQSRAAQTHLPLVGKACSNRTIHRFVDIAIIENHGGSITVDSVPGEGSTFIVRLPVAGPDTSSDTEPESPGAEGTMDAQPLDTEPTDADPTPE